MQFLKRQLNSTKKEQSSPVNPDLVYPGIWYPDGKPSEHTHSGFRRRKIIKWNLAFWPQEKRIL